MSFLEKNKKEIIKKSFFQIFKKDLEKINKDVFSFESNIFLKSKTNKKNTLEMKNKERLNYLLKTKFQSLPNIFINSKTILLLFGRSVDKKISEKSLFLSLSICS